MRITPAILCGGSGTRLWPVSRTRAPKQFLRFGGEASLLQQTATRVRGDLFGGLIAVTAAESRHTVEAHLDDAGVRLDALICEPCPRNTAPALAALAAYLLEEGRDDPVIALPSDHYVPDADAFEATVRNLLPAVLDNAIGLIGIAPTRPDTQLGYIRLASAHAGSGGPAGDSVRQVAQFIEKPNAAVAARLVQDPEVCWNAGIFMFRPSILAREIDRFAPAIGTNCRAAVSGARREGRTIHLEEAAFSACDARQIDTAVMEKTDRAVCIRATFDWHDLGSWRALWRLSEKDEDGNARSGRVVARDVSGSHLHSSGPLVAAFGVRDLVIAATEDAVLVADLARTDDLGNLVRAMKTARQREADDPATEMRPWGTFRKLAASERHQVKELTIHPGRSISLQRHRRRSEHWVVVDGTARITRDGEVRLLSPGESIEIPAGTVHRLENGGDAPLIVIETQTGDYLGEDDIERLEDIYGRV